MLFFRNEIGRTTAGIEEAGAARFSVHATVAAHVSTSFSAFFSLQSRCLMHWALSLKDPRRSRFRSQNA
jgi:hypothetical protein